MAPLNFERMGAFALDISRLNASCAWNEMDYVNACKITVSKIIVVDLDINLANDRTKNSDNDTNEYKDRGVNEDEAQADKHGHGKFQRPVEAGWNRTVD
jgi:hypothetical protein